MNKLTILGTGNAMVTHCFNTCFILHHDDQKLMVDAGGGNGILRQMEQAKIPFTDIHDLFLTHAHTDHVMGAVWVVRKVTSLQRMGKYDGTLRIYGHDKVLHVLHTMCDMMLPKKFTAMTMRLACHYRRSTSTPPRRNSLVSLQPCQTA